MNTTTFNCISLFDGISATYLALQKAGIKIEHYCSAEIEKNALKVQQHHYGNNASFVPIGDVRTVNVDSFSIDKDIIFVFGFPCLDLSSIKKNRQGLQGPESSLFFEALRILKALHNRMQASGKKIYFVAENVASMRETDKEAILNHLKEFCPSTQVIKIDSAVISASQRKRLYFTNIPGIQHPTEVSINLSDIIENGYVDKIKSNAVLSSNVTLFKSGLKRYLTMSLGTIIFKEEVFAQLSKQEKLDRFPSLLKASNYNGKPQKGASELDFVNGVYRLPSIKEYCRLMTFPDDYLEVPFLSKTAKVKLLGLSMTVDVMAHLLNHLNK